MSKAQILSLYQQLIRESKKFDSYNYRNYALRRIRDAFKENKQLADKAAIQEQIDYGKKNLDIIRRQVIIGHLYSSEKLVIEGQQKQKNS